MDRKYACYCGLYCENCAVKVKVEPASKVLYQEMNKLGFEEIMPYFPNGDKFWSFLKGMSVEGVCISCRQEVETRPARSGFVQKKRMLICALFAIVIRASISLSFLKAIQCLNKTILFCERKDGSLGKNFRMNAGQEVLGLHTERNLKI
jgi:hypothetical protein